MITQTTLILVMMTLTAGSSLVFYFALSHSECINIGDNITGIVDLFMNIPSKALSHDCKLKLLYNSLESAEKQCHNISQDYFVAAAHFGNSLGLTIEATLDSAFNDCVSKPLAKALELKILNRSIVEAGCVLIKLPNSNLLCTRNSWKMFHRFGGDCSNIPNDSIAMPVFNESECNKEEIFWISMARNYSQTLEFKIMVGDDIEELCMNFTLCAKLFEPFIHKNQTLFENIFKEFTKQDLHDYTNVKNLNTNEARNFNIHEKFTEQDSKNYKKGKNRKNSKEAGDVKSKFNIHEEFAKQNSQNYTKVKNRKNSNEVVNIESDQKFNIRETKQDFTSSEDQKNPNNYLENNRKERSIISKEERLAIEKRRIKALCSLKIKANQICILE